MLTGKTYQNLPVLTKNIRTNMVPEHVDTIKTANNAALDTDQEFTLSALEDVLHRLSGTAPGEDSA